MSAACHAGSQEMVPGPDDQADPTATAEGRQAVLQAKKVCATCPVVAPCLAEAQAVAARLGPEWAQGVWGGLTQRERDTWHGLGTGPRPCARCGLDCVPINLTATECSACNPRQRARYDDYRDLAVPLIRAGQTPLQVAEALRLDQSVLAGACRRWKVTIVNREPRGKRPVKECGTVAAKHRHRKNGESWEHCACRDVPWRTSKRKSPTGE